MANEMTFSFRIAAAGAAKFAKDFGDMGGTVKDLQRDVSQFNKTAGDNSKVIALRNSVKSAGERFNEAQARVKELREPFVVLTDDAPLKRHRQLYDLVICLPFVILTNAPSKPHHPFHSYAVPHKLRTHGVGDVLVSGVADGVVAFDIGADDEGDPTNDEWGAGDGGGFTQRVAEGVVRFARAGS